MAAQVPEGVYMTEDVNISLQTPAAVVVPEDIEVATVESSDIVQIEAVHISKKPVQESSWTPEMLADFKLQLTTHRQTRHDCAMALALANPAGTNVEAKKANVELQLSSKIQYKKEEYMFPKYVQDLQPNAKEKQAEEPKEIKKPPKRKKMEEEPVERVETKPEVPPDDSNYFDDLFNDNPDEDIRAFTTLKDVADYEVKRTEELWKRVETEENFDFTNYPNFVEDDSIKKEVPDESYGEVEQSFDDTDDEDSDNKRKRKSTSHHDLSKKKRRKKTIELTPEEMKDSLLSADKKAFYTKRGSLRIRSERGDHRQHFPEINPIMRIEGMDPKPPPKTLDDYLVMKSVATKRFMFDKSVSPQERYVLRKTYMDKVEEDVKPELDVKVEEGEDEDSKKPNAPLARHIYGCIYCNFMGVKKNWLKHLRNKHRDVDGLMFCTYTKFCQMPFDKIEWLDKHIETVHQTHEQTGPRSTSVLMYERTDVKPDPSPDEGPDKFSPTKKSGLFYCMFCDYSHSKRNWVEHLKKKHSDQELYFCVSSKSCNLIFDTAEKRDAHVAVMHDSFTCNVCGEQFKQEITFKEHRKIHNPPVSVTYYPLKSIVAVLNLEIFFLKNDPEGDADLEADNCHMCTYCGKRYRTRKGCREHEALRHAPQKLRHRCDYVDPPEKGGQKCLAAFYSAKELVIHKRKHTGELPFICGYCGNRYRSKATLVQHERQQHFDSEVSLLPSLRPAIS